MIEKFGFAPLPMDARAVAALAELYRQEKILAEQYQADLWHIAAAVSSFVDIVVSYNFAHIANERVVRLVKSVNIKDAFRTDFSILPPEEVILYED